MFAEVSLEFLETKSPSEKADFGDDRENDIIGNANFADAAAHGIVAGALTAKGAAVRTAVTDAAGGNDVQKNALVTVVGSWNIEARRWAKYVTEKAQEKATLPEQIAVIVSAGFDYNKVTKTQGSPSPQVTGFLMKSINGVPAKSAIKSDSQDRETTYVSIFHTDSDKLDEIDFTHDDQIILPASTEPFIIHTTTDSRQQEVTLSSAKKYYGIRFALNRSGRGPASAKASTVTQ